MKKDLEAIKKEFEEHKIESEDEIAELKN